jgi:hyperosmotically inducible protein
MIRKSSRIIRLLVSLGSLVFCAFLLATPATRVQDPPPPPPGPDSTKTPDSSSDQQKMNPADRAISQKIRRAIHDDKELSTDARNIKVIAHDGKVTLRGPVRSEEEKSELQAKVVSVVGQDNVTNLLDVIPPK